MLKNILLLLPLLLIGTSPSVCWGYVFKFPLSDLAISEMHQHLYNLSQQQVDLWSKGYVAVLTLLSQYVALIVL